jgi:Glycosyl transferase 4-like domain
MPGTGASVPRPRVLLLIKGLGLGGAERLLVDVVGARDRERFDYEVAYVLSEQDALVSAMEGTGVPVHGLGAAASADLRWTAALRRLLVQGRFDVLHAHLPYTAAFGRLAALTLPRARRPAVVYTACGTRRRC